MHGRESAMGRGRRMALFLAIMSVAAVLDQLTKVLARDFLSTGDMTLVPGVLDLVLLKNTGAAFSIGEGSQWLFVLMAIVVVAAAAIFVLRAEGLTIPLVCSLACVAGGGIGNLIDRVVFGEVTDFLATSFIDFPVFNVADVFVTCGVAVALVCLWRWDERGASESNEAPGGDRG